MKYNHNLSSQDFRLYEFLKQHNHWVTQKEIALTMPDVFPCTIEDMQDFHNSAVRHAITNSIRRLNDSGYIHKIILSGARGIKIATEEEFDLYIASNINAALKRLQRLKKLATKADRDGQYQIQFGEYQKEIVDVFVEK